MALNGRLAHAPRRQLSGEKRSRQSVTGAAESDPNRRFATLKCRSAKGLFDDLVSAAEQPYRQTIPAKFY